MRLGSFIGALVAATVFASAPASAEEPNDRTWNDVEPPGFSSSSPRRSSTDTSYGRIDGDVSFTAALGATFGPRAPRGAIDFRLRYLWTAGLFVTYEDALGGSAEPRRALATGVEIRPLFLARWSSGYETGNGYLDLMLDSLGLEIGAAFAEPRGRPFGRPGFQLGAGMQIPIFPNATGMFVGVHGGARWMEAALAGESVLAAGDRSGYFLLTIGWQQVFGAHIVDLGDRRDE